MGRDGAGWGGQWGRKQGSAIIMEFTDNISCHFFPFNLKMDISKSTTLTFSVIIHFWGPV